MVGNSSARPAARCRVLRRLRGCGLARLSRMTLQKLCRASVLRANSKQSRAAHSGPLRGCTEDDTAGPAAPPARFVSVWRREGGPPHVLRFAELIRLCLRKKEVIFCDARRGGWLYEETHPGDYKLSIEAKLAIVDYNKKLPLKTH